MTWNVGRSEVEAMLNTGRIDTVEASLTLAQRYLVEAQGHLKFAALGLKDLDDVDLPGVLQLCYDAARKSAASLMAARGLRATVRGGHVAVVACVKAQFNGPSGMAVFGEMDRLRRRRNDSEYPSLSTPTLTLEDCEHAYSVATAVFTGAQSLLGTGKITAFTA